MTSNRLNPFHSLRLGLALIFILFMAVTSWGYHGYCGSRANGANGRNLTYELEETNHLIKIGEKEKSAYRLKIEGWGAMDDSPAFIKHPGYMRRVIEIQLREGLTHIGKDAFGQCENYCGILTIPSTVETIGAKAFELFGRNGFDVDIDMSKCTRMTRLTAGAFHGYNKTVTLPASLTTIEANTFDDDEVTVMMHYDGYLFINGELIATGTGEMDITNALNITDNGNPKNTIRNANFNEMVLLDELLENTPIDPSDNHLVLPGGWYLLDKNMDFPHSILFTGDVNIIVADGVTLNIAELQSEGDFNIFGQTENSGKINIQGTLEATNIDINGISVKSDHISAGANFVVNSGSVDVGTITSKSIVLGWHKKSDFIKIKSIDSKTLDMFGIAEGSAFVDEDGVLYANTVYQEKKDDAVNQLIGKTLKPCYAVTIDLQNGQLPPKYAAIFDENGDAHIEEPKDEPYRADAKFLGYSVSPKHGSASYDWSQPITSNTTVYTQWSQEDFKVEYVDEKGEVKEIEEHLALTKAMDLQYDAVNDRFVLPGGWYTIEKDVLHEGYPKNLYFDGDVNLIIRDEVYGDAQFQMDYDFIAKGNLTIYGQTKGTGTLNIGAIVSEEYNVTINGGHVFASTVSADLNVYVNGGNVDITKSGLGIQPRLKTVLDWYNLKNSIKASYYGNKQGKVIIAEGKVFKDENGKAYFGTLNSEQIADIAGKTLTPYVPKSITDESITIADIPDQTWTGSEICPAVSVTDGETPLVLGTDYTVGCSNNISKGTANMTITGMGVYAETVEKTFEIVPKVILVSGAVQVFEDENGKRAVLNGEYDGTEAVNIAENIENVAVTFNRKFTPNSGHATIMLPFDVKASELTGVKSIIEFTGITKVNGNNAVGMGYVWCNETLGEEELKKGHPDCNTVSAELNAYTPYMIEMDSPTLEINGGVTLVKWSEYDENHKRVGDAPVGNWVFRGTLQKKQWPKGTGIINDGRLWAFTAAERSGAKIGEFVQFGGNNWANPFRAYLVECKKTDNGLDCQDDSEPKASQVSRYRFADALVPTDSAATDEPLVMRGVAASETASLNSMDIVIVYGDKDSDGDKERPTVIGRFNPATGEIRMLPRTKQTYDLKGRRVGNGKKAKGAYYKK